MARKSRDRWYAEVTKLASGLRKHMPTQTLVFSGKSMTVPEVLDELALLPAAAQKTAAAKAAWGQAVAAETEVRERRVKPLALRLGDLLRVMFGASSAKLLDFGIKPRKRAKPSMKTQAAALQKSKATRTARGTMGKRQRRKVKAP